jgi:hypothetical protein
MASQALSRRRVDLIVALASGALSLAVTALLFEAVTDRDWSLAGWEWVDVVAIAPLVIAIAGWVFFRIAPQATAPTTERLQGREARQTTTVASGAGRLTSAASAPEGIIRLLTTNVSGWAMALGERAAIEGVLAALRPRLSIEIGTHRGGSLGPISRYSHTVHTFDTSARPEVNPDQFPNVSFHVGDSHQELAPLLAELAAAGENVDFALVDGDHSTVGAVTDIVDLLASPAVGRSIILVHDAIHPRVRNALEQIDYDSFGKVSLVDFDFVEGFAMAEGEKKDQTWGGFALIATGWDNVESVYPHRYPAPLVWEAFSRSLGADDPITATQVAYVEEQYETERNLVRLMESSLSWRITKPLRTAKRLRRRLR